MTRDSILAALHDPTRAWFVIMIGVVLIYRELPAPGRVLPGVLGGVAAALACTRCFESMAASKRLRCSWEPPRCWSCRLSTILLASALVAQRAIDLAVHSLTTPRIGLFPALAAIPLSGITGFLLRTAVLARRNKVSIE